MRRVYFCLVCWFSIITTFFILCSNLIFLPILLAQGLSPPAVSTGEATDVTSSSVTLNGTLSGRAPSVWFEYGTTSSLYDSTASASWGGPGIDTVSSSIYGLSAATTYYYRIAAYDSAPGYTTDTAHGSEKSFTTLSPIPTVTPCGDISTDEATDVTSNSATLNATVCIGITAGQTYFEYGTTSGTYTNSIDTRRDDLLNNVYARISGLSTATTYYYRIVVVQKGTPLNPTGYTYGEEKFFVTLSETPTPTVTPTPLCEAESVSVLPKRLILKRGKSHEVTVNLKGKNGCSTEDKIITATISKISSKRISVMPTSQVTDENDTAEFIITAGNKVGNARVTFKADSQKISLTVKVR